jgi:integrase
MSAVYIKTRTGKTGKRFIVYYRRGGRAFPEEYGGSFKTAKDAKIRRDVIAGELAAGRDPRIFLEALRTPPPPAAGLADIWDTFIAGRVDVRQKTANAAKLSKAHWTRILGEARDPHTITPADIIAGIAELYEETEDSKGLAPDTIAQYLNGLAQLLDYADIEPNPARSKKVKLPKGDLEEINPPATATWLLIRDHAKKRSVLPMRLMECCGLRIAECVNLTFGDIDFHEGRIRVSRARTKTLSGQRWLNVPRELLNEIADLCPLEDRTAERPVFAVDHGAVRYDFSQACIKAGLPARAYSPHDLRHRRISLWYRHKIDAITVKTWAGHSKASMGLDRYGHVMIDHRDDEWRTFWLSVYEGERSSGAAQVSHGGSSDG